MRQNLSNNLQSSKVISFIKLIRFNTIVNPTDFFSTKGQECLSDNVITIGFCFLSVLPDSMEEKQHFMFKLIEGKECK